MQKEVGCAFFDSRNGGCELRSKLFHYLTSPKKAAEAGVIEPLYTRRFDTNTLPVPSLAWKSGGGAFDYKCGAGSPINPKDNRDGYEADGDKQKGCDTYYRPGTSPEAQLHKLSNRKLLPNNG